MAQVSEGTCSLLDWPAELEQVLVELSRGRGTGVERRRGDRAEYRVTARLWLLADGPAAPPRPLYTRDVNLKGLGFLTRQRLPLNFGGRLEIPAPDGRLLQINCTILRCHPATPQWFQGSLYFNREQWSFAELVG